MPVVQVCWHQGIRVYEVRSVVARRPFSKRYWCSTVEWKTVDWWVVFDRIYRNRSRESSEWCVSTISNLNFWCRITVALAACIHVGH